jgi:phosphopantetheinyl transferase
LSLLREIESLDLPSLPPGASAVWLTFDSSTDPMRSILFGPEELAAIASRPGPPRRKAERAWGRLAAKEAALRLLAAPLRAADLAIEPDPHGRPQLRWVGTAQGPEALPAVSIAHTAGLAVALASADPSAPVGIDVERVVPRERRFIELALEPGGVAALERVASREEWVARLWCAKEALGKATGRGLIVGPASVVIVEVEPSSGLVLARPGPELAAACPTWPVDPVRVWTGRRGNHAWAWTLGELAPSAAI